MRGKTVKCLLKALPHYQWWARSSEPTAPKALLSGISLSCVWTPLAPAVLGLRRTRGQCGLQASVSGISPSPSYELVFPFPPFFFISFTPFLSLIQGFSSSSISYFSLFCPCVPPTSFFFPSHIPCPCHINLLRFTLLLSTSYHFVAYFKLFSCLQPYSSSLYCYTLVYFSLLLHYFSHLLFHPCHSFQKFQLCLAHFLGPDRSVLHLLLIASDDALKTLFSTFIIITNLLSSLLEFILGLCATQLPNFICFICGRTVSTGTSVAMFIHPSTLQPYMAPNGRSSRQHCNFLRISSFMFSSGPPLLQCVLWAGVRRHNGLCAA